MVSHRSCRFSFLCGPFCSFTTVPGQRSTNHPGSTSVGSPRPVVRQAPPRRRPALARSPSPASTAAAAVAGSAYSNDYEVPGTESGRATAPPGGGLPRPGRRQRHRRLAHRAAAASAPPTSSRRMTQTLDADRRAARRRLRRRPVRRAEGAAQISADGRTAYATVTFDEPADDIPKAQAEAVVDTAKAADGPTASRSSSAAAPSRSPRPPADTSPRSSASPSPPSCSSSPSARSPPACCPSPPPWCSVGTAYVGHRAARPRR